MASIRKKKNGSYMIRVSRGYDSKGKQNEHFMVFKPKPGMSEKQIEKALNKAAVEFEREIKNDLVNVGDLRLKELCELWFAEQKKPIIEGGKKVKRTTLSGYKALSVRIYEALGHIRIKKLTVDHLNIFYAQLLQPGSRRDTKYRPIVDMGELLDGLGLTRTAAAKEVGISANTMFQLCPKRSTKPAANTTREIAEKIAALVGQKFEAIYAPAKEDAGLDDSTIHRYHEFIGVVLSWAVTKKWLQYNICYRNAPSVGPRKEIEYYTEEQVDEFVESLMGADPRFIAVACIAFFMGLRRAEICGLDIYKDIDLKRGSMRIRCNHLYTSEDGCFTDTPKTTSSVRTLKIIKPVRQAIGFVREWQKRQRQLVGDKWQDSGRLITDEYGRPIHPDTVSNWMSRHRKKHNLPYITLRGARHTNATILIYNHVDIANVANQLGHAKIITTFNTYTHIIEEAGQKEIADVLEGRYGNCLDRFHMDSDPPEE